MGGERSPLLLRAGGRLPVEAQDEHRQQRLRSKEKSLCLETQVCGSPALCSSPMACVQAEVASSNTGFIFFSFFSKCSFHVTSCCMSGDTHTWIAASAVVTEVIKLLSV